jgi:o-succinylbenzoate synthase
VVHERTGWLVLLEDAEGRGGLGDCAPLPAAGTEDQDRAHAWLGGTLSRLTGRAAPEPEGLGDGPPAARCAVETALLDLKARRASLPLWRLLGGGAPRAIACNAHLGALTGVDAERVAGAAHAGFRVLKLKLGLRPLEEEIALLHRLCRALPRGCRLRLDANGAWSESEARRFLEASAGLPIEMLEEPLREARIAALGRLQSLTDYPLAIDEGLWRIGPAKLLQGAPVRRLVLKAASAGGPLRARALAEAARARGLQCVVTTSIESAVGVWAALHLAAAAGEPTLAHGLATASWLAADLGDPPPLADGRMARPAAPGLGFLPLDAP